MALRMFTVFNVNGIMRAKIYLQTNSKEHSMIVQSFENLAEAVEKNMPYWYMCSDLKLSVEPVHVSDDRLANADFMENRLILPRSHSKRNEIVCQCQKYCDGEGEFSMKTVFDLIVSL